MLKGRLGQSKRFWKDGTSQYTLKISLLKTLYTNYKTFKSLKDDKT